MRIRFLKSIIPILIIPIIGLLIFFSLNLYKNLYKKITPPKYNLILISIDTLRADHMGVYGYEKNTTPNIDKWAKNAIVFDRAYTNIPLTFPSFAALMTGISPFESGITNNNYDKNKMNAPLINSSSITISEIFKENGYKTAAFVANDYLSPELTNLNKGFDEYKYFKNDNNKDKIYEPFIESALKWLDINKDNKLFFWIHLIDPHSPYNPPEELKCRFDMNYCSLINELSSIDLENKRKSMEGISDGCRQKKLPENTIKTYETLYDGEIAYTDSVFGKIISKIEKLNISDNSIVILLADHGEEFSHNYYFTHGGMLYDSSVKISLIMKIPGSNKSQKRINILTENTDIKNLITRLYSFKGLNFSDVIKKLYFNAINHQFGSELNAQKNILFSDDALTKFGITDGNYKYIYSTEKGCKNNILNEEIYDLIQDPKEEKNIDTENSAITKLKDSLNMKIKKNYFNIESTINNKIKSNKKLKEEFGSFSY